MPRPQSHASRRPAGLSRSLIVRAALSEGRTRGLQNISLRRVANALSVTPMALYRYVESREDLLSGVSDLLLREASVTSHREDDWRAWTCRVFEKIYDALSAPEGGVMLLAPTPAVLQRAREFVRGLVEPTR